MRFRDGELFDQQAASSIEHLALAERQLLVALENQQVAENLCDFQRGTGLDFFRVLALAAIPGLSIHLDLALAQNPVDFIDHILADNPAQAYLLHVFGRDHYRHLFRTENSQHVKFALGTRDYPHLNVVNNRNTMSGINNLFAFFE